MTNSEIAEISRSDNKARQRGFQSSEKLAKALGLRWPCGHHKTPLTTHTVGPSVQCRVCRRKRIMLAIRLVSERRRIWAISGEYLQQPDQKPTSRDNVQTAAHALLHYPSPGRLPLKALQRGITAHFGQRADDMTSKSRVAHMVRMKAVLIRILKERGLSYPTIGRAMGGRDHSTIINAMNNYDIYERADPRVAEAYNLFKDRKVNG